MARFFVYRTDFNNTVVRQSLTSSATGGTELEISLEFFIPEIQPTYFWRYNGSTIVPNNEVDINNWVQHIAPAPTPYDMVTYGVLTGLTSQKINIQTGATVNHIAVFDSTGNVIDGGYKISDITGGTVSSGVSWVVFWQYTGATEQRLIAIESDITGLTATKIDKVTGATDYLPIFTSDGNLISSGYKIADLTGATNIILTGLTADISSLSAQTLANTADIMNLATWSGETTADIQNLAVWSGQTNAYLAYLSGQTDLKLNITDFANYTGVTQPILDAALTGVTNLGTGSELGAVLDRNVTIKSIAGLGGVTIIESGDTIVISGETNATATWDSITNKPAWLTGTTLQEFEDGHEHTQYTLKTDFDGHTGDTSIHFTMAEITGFTTSSDFSSHTGDTSIHFTMAEITGFTTNAEFTGLTEAFVSHTGDTSIHFTMDEITGFTKTSDFTGYTAITESRIQGIEADIDYLSGITSGNTSSIDYLSDLTAYISGETSANTVNIAANTADIANLAVWSGETNNYLTYLSGETAANTADIANLIIWSGETNADIAYISGITDTKLATVIFTGYTASTANKDKKIVLVSNATTDINKITPVEITWASATLYDGTGRVFTGTSDTYYWSGGSNVWILEAGIYEVQYHITLKNGSGGVSRSIGSYVRISGLTINVTASGAVLMVADATEVLTIPPTVLSIEPNELDVIAFRITNAGTVNTVPNSVSLTINRLS